MVHVQPRGKIYRSYKLRFIACHFSKAHFGISCNGFYTLKYDTVAFQQRNFRTNKRDSVSTGVASCFLKFRENSATAAQRQLILVRARTNYINLYSYGCRGRGEVNECHFFF